MRERSTGAGRGSVFGRERARRRREHRERRDHLIRRGRAAGKAIRAIARELQITPKTVRRVLRARALVPRLRPSKLDAYRPLIRKYVLEDGLTGVRVLEKIREVGYDGSYSVLKRFIKTFRPGPAVRPHLRFETQPGEQGQVDLSPYTVLLGGAPTRVTCFSLVLGWSRWQFIRFTLHGEVHGVCHGHVLAFEEAGGVPTEILYDRMKQVVLESYADGVVYHPLFEAMAQHYGFRAVPLAPGYKEGKGKVENPFRYVEGNFLAGRTFHDLDDLNGQAAQWLHDVARVRQHRTTMERPVDRLAIERGHLRPLPDRRFDASRRETRQVGADFCVPFETNRYSVLPDCAGHTAIVRALDGILTIEVCGQTFTHRLRDTRHDRSVLPEHEAAFRAHSTSRHVLAEQFARLGSAAADFAAGLRRDKGSSAGYHMSRILQIADRVGVLRVGEALRHGVRYGAFDATAIERIVAGKTPPARIAEDAGTAAIPTHMAAYLKGAGSHQRSLAHYAQQVRAADAAMKREPAVDADAEGVDHGE